MLRTMMGAALLSLPFGLTASPMTGIQALEVFTGSTDARQMMAIYVMGVMHAETAIKINAAMAEKAGADWYIKPICIPPAASAVQGASIVEKALRSNPERNHEDFYVLARRALQTAWPCEQ